MFTYFMRQLAMSDYEPCPFCGSEKIFMIENKDNWLWSVTCYDCSVLGPLCPDEASAKAWWNKRGKMKEEGKLNLVKKLHQAKEDSEKLAKINESINRADHVRKRPRNNPSPTHDPFVL